MGPDKNNAIPNQRIRSTYRKVYIKGKNGEMRIPASIMVLEHPEELGGAAGV